MIEFSRVNVLHDHVKEITGGGVTERIARGSMENLEARVDRQNMIIQTLLMLLLEKKVLQEEEMREWLRYVDGLDGRVDGRLRPATMPVNCPACSRVNAPNSLRCQYCGKDFDAAVTDPRARPA